MERYVWILADVVIGSMMFFFYMSKLKETDHWYEEQLETVKSGLPKSMGAGEVYGIIHDPIQRPIKHTGVHFLTLGFWFLCFFWIALGSYSQPNPGLPNTPLSTVLVVAVFLLLSLGPWFFVIHGYKSGHAIRIVAQNGIVNLKPLAKKSLIRWGEVKSVRVAHNKIGAWWFSVSTETGRIDLRPNYSDIDKFAEGIMNNVMRDRWVKAEMHLKKVIPQDRIMSDRWTKTKRYLEAVVPQDSTMPKQ